MSGAIVTAVIAILSALAKAIRILTRLEDKLDLALATQADHEDRLRKLEGRPALKGATAQG